MTRSNGASVKILSQPFSSYLVVLETLFLIHTNFFEISVIIRHHATIFSTIDEDRLGLRMKKMPRDTLVHLVFDDFVESRVENWD